VIIDHNTFNCDIGGNKAAFEIGSTGNSRHANWTISNNLVQSLEATDNVTKVNAGSPTWTANRYNAGSSVPGTGWTKCTATFAADGFRLDASDTCAIDKAINSTVTVDYDRRTRTGAFDVGAHDLGGSGGTAPSPGSARFSASSYSGSEGQSVTVSIQRAGGSAGSGSVRVVTASGTAISGTDFTAVSQTVTWASGDATTKTVSVPLLNDQIVEGTETFTVRLENASGVSLGSPSSATVTITDTTAAAAPGKVRFSSSSYSGSEGGTVSVAVRRVNGSDGAASVRVVSVSGTATSGSDFGAISQTVSWAGGDATTHTVTIQLLSDQSVEGNETFTVRLENPTGVSLGSPSSATVTITDTTTPPVPTPGSAQFASSSYSGSEGGAVSITVLRVNGAQGAASVRVVSASGTAVSGSDFGALSQTVSWADGDATPRTVQVNLLADQHVEGTESFTVRLENATGVSLGSPASATVTIADTTTPQPGPGGMVRFSSSVFGGREGDSVQTTIERVDGSSGAASVRVYTVDGSASSSDDFAAVSQTVGWTDGDASPRSVVLQLFADSLIEGQESFSVHLDQATGVALGSPSATTVVIEDANTPDEDPLGSIITFERESVTVTEGMTVRVTLLREGSADGQVSVRYYTLEGSAKAGTDFVAQSGDVVWSDGSNAPQQISIATINDSIHEPSESFAIQLAAPTGFAELGSRSSVLVTIVDNDAPAAETSAGAVRFVHATESVGEGDGTLEVLIERIGGTFGAASVQVSTVAGSAEAHRDFVPKTQTLYWGNKEGGTKRFLVEILQDDETEGTESFEVRLRNPSQVAISGPATATITIHDDEIESLPSVTVADDGESPVTAAQSDGGVAILWQTQGATAEAQVRLFDSAGTPTSATMPIAAPGQAVQQPVITFDRDGGAGLIWFESNPYAFGQVVVARRSPAHDLARGNRLVLGSTAVDARDLRLAADGYGRYLVTWRADGRIQFRGFDDQGALPLASSMVAVPNHRIDLTLGGEAVMVFELAGSIAYLRLDRTGAATGAPIRVAPDVPARRPDVAVAADGRFVLVWEVDTGRPETGSDIFGQVFDATGVPEGLAFRVNTQAAGDQTTPRVDANAAGDFAVTWADDLSGGRVLVRFFESTGKALGGDLVVAGNDGLGEPKEPQVAIADDDDATVVFTREDASGSRGVYLRTFQPQLGAGRCIAGGSKICLADGRFRVRAIWTDRSGLKAQATGSALTADTGYFWFFDPANIELVVKTLDACGFNQRQWVFAGGLTDVEVILQVDDTVTGDSRTYFAREGGSFVPIRDTDAFVECDAEGSPSLLLDEELSWPLLVESGGVASAEQCGASTGLCLGNARFRVEAAWRQGAAGGPADSVPLTSDTGYFWFFDQDNVELVVKVLDACGVNGSFWVFGGGLTDVGVDLSVTDTWTGERIDYSSASGHPFAPILDTKGLSLACSVAAP
jgi:C4-type Zn-finger protein